MDQKWMTTGRNVGGGLTPTTGGLSGSQLPADWKQNRKESLKCFGKQRQLAIVLDERPNLWAVGEDAAGEIGLGQQFAQSSTVS